MSRIRKVDLNQQEIVRDLRALGYSVRHTHTIGKGFPDIVIGRHGRNLLVEIKRKGEPLTADERDFFAEWRGVAFIGHDAEEVHAHFMKLLLLDLLTRFMSGLCVPVCPGACGIGNTT